MCTSQTILIASKRIHVFCWLFSTELNKCKICAGTYVCYMEKYEYIIFVGMSLTFVLGLFRFID